MWEPRVSFHCAHMVKRQSSAMLILILVLSVQNSAIITLMTECALLIASNVTCCGNPQDYSLNILNRD